ncbi:hypothetical protein SNE40_010183 [Patella caerulea]|uniref:Uncharacterized protein n=1 Tax=Patella caerulea TaxID=87958 RepID=A0AAN8JVF7_PATCE
MAVVEKIQGKLTEGLVLARTRAQDLESVRKLNCWASDITDISIIRKMPDLEVCSLSGNKISTLEDFSHCPNLQELYIRKNNLTELTDIHWLKKLTKLRVLWLSDNPCSTGDNYRLSVLKTLPNIQKLDNIVVTEDEINRALEEGNDVPLPAKYPTDSPVIEPESEQIQEPPVITENLQNHKISDPVALSWDETNKIRQELGLKPLPYEKVSTTKSVTTGITKARHANILQATLHLIKELDKDSLEIVENAVKTRLESL